MKKFIVEKIFPEVAWALDTAGHASATFFDAVTVFHELVNTRLNSPCLGQTVLASAIVGHASKAFFDAIA
eukprot:7941452-Karenia_brevis.AAC.1